MKRLIILSAPSGAGKTTLCARLLRDFPSLRLSVSCTTRPPRGEERDGVHYFFLSREEFEKQIQAGRFAEWAQVHGNYYGTSKDFLEQCFAEGYSVLLDIDVQGAASLKKAYPAEAYLVFVSPPDLTTLEKRLRSRDTDNEETIQRRLANARAEMEKARLFDKTIVNDDLERAYAELHALVARQLANANPGGGS